MFGNESVSHPSVTGSIPVRETFLLCVAVGWLDKEEAVLSNWQWRICKFGVEPEPQFLKQAEFILSLNSSVG